MGDQEFGSSWTSDKLRVLREYLSAYLHILRGPKAKGFYRLTYLDAFAGTGNIAIGKRDPRGQDRLIDVGDEETLIAGSARVALEQEMSFDEYVFIEQSSAKVARLESLKNEYPERADKIRVVREDANSFLQSWSKTVSRQTRAVVFIDPFGMQLSWETMVSLAETGCCDVWILFPLSAVNRVLTEKGKLPDQWASRLDVFFGTKEWRKAFYKEREVETLFGTEIETIRQADFSAISEYFADRLNGIFAATIREPRVLRNSRGTPLFLLSFATANPKSVKVAIRVAQYLAEK
ncbi:MAG: three-Cys-motif partner protein TcmP [Armatimonadetes bacterium]|nr:three-Cys-motif partner protein TcmP [Armatimonadota bacterium]